MAASALKATETTTGATVSNRELYDTTKYPLMLVVLKNRNFVGVVVKDGLFKTGFFRYSEVL